MKEDDKKELARCNAQLEERMLKIIKLLEGAMTSFHEKVEFHQALQEKRDQAVLQFLEKLREKAMGTAHLKELRVRGVCRGLYPPYLTVDSSGQISWIKECKENTVLYPATADIHPPFLPALEHLILASELTIDTFEC